MTDNSNADTQILSGWNRFPVGKTGFREVDDLFLYYREDCPRIVRGNGRSYGDSSFCTEGVTFGMLPRNRLLSLNETTGVLRTEAGATLDEILRAVVPRGWFLPVTPGTKFATLGGCIACDVHGKNHHLCGNISSFVDSLTMLFPDGSQTTCSREVKPDLFWATCGGLGLSGMIVDATIRLKKIETSYIQVRLDKCQNLDAVMALLQDQPEKFHYSVAWMDCLARGKRLGRSILMRGDHSRREDLPAALRATPFVTHGDAQISLPFDLPGAALNPLSVKLFNAAYYHKLRAKTQYHTQHYDPYFYPLDGIGHWNRLYGRRGYLQYQCVLPYETARAGLAYLLDAFSGSGNGSFLAVLKTMGEEAGPLGFPKPGFTLALDMPASGAPLLDLLDRIDQEVTDLGGRVYLAKDSRMKPVWLPRMYPRLEEWRSVIRKYNPQSLSQSHLSRRLGLTA